MRGLLKHSFGLKWIDYGEFTKLNYTPTELFEFKKRNGKNTKKRGKEVGWFIFR